MRIYPAIHYTMGGLWVDYNLMSNIPGLYVLGEANFSDHGANRLGASALDAGPRRRLLRAPGHHRRLPRPAARHRPGPDRRPGVPRGRGVGGERVTACSRSTAPAPSTTSTASSARSSGTTAAWPERARASRRPSAQIPGCATSSAGRPGAGRGRDVQPVAREGRPGRGLPRVRRAAVPRRPATARRAAAATSGSSTRPRTARRCATTTTSRTSAPGSTRRSRRPVLHKEPLAFENVHLAQRCYK